MRLTDYEGYDAHGEFSPDGNSDGNGNTDIYRVSMRGLDCERIA